MQYKKAIKDPRRKVSLELDFWLIQFYYWTISVIKRQES